MSSNVNQWVIDWMLDHPNEKQVCIIISQSDVEALIDRDIHPVDWENLACILDSNLPDNHMWEVITELSSDLKREIDSLNERESDDGDWRDPD
jgi:hypothetical protein